MLATTKCKLLLAAMMLAVLGAATLVAPAKGVVFYLHSLTAGPPLSKINPRAQAARPKSDKSVDASRSTRLAPPKNDQVIALNTPNPEIETKSDAVGTSTHTPAAYTKTDQSYEQTRQAPEVSSKGDEVDGTGSANRVAASGDKVSASPMVSEKPVMVSDSISLPPATEASEACLIKQHLATGAVLFKDSCTKEWAINSTKAAQRRLDRKCLRKRRQSDGVVMFQDVCTGEWAMNTAKGIERPEPKD